MKKMILMAMLLLPLTMLNAKKMSFIVNGPEEYYNRVSVVNETSQEDFKCRLVIMDDEDNTVDIYGVYELKDNGDADSNSKWLYRGSKVGIEMPKNFPVEVSFSVEYKDYPFYDMLIIRLFDQTTEFDEQ